MTNPEPDPTRRSLVGRLLSARVTLTVGFLLIVVAVPFVYRESRLWGVPAVEPFDVEAFLDEYEVDPTAGCWLDYERATAVLVPDAAFVARSVGDEFYAGYDGWEHADEPFRDYVAANRPALEAWRVAMQADFAPPHVVRADANDLDGQISVQHSREFVRLAKVEAERLRLSGETENAWNLHEAVLRFSGHLSRSASGIDPLVAAAFTAMVADELADWSREPAVSAEQLRAARRLVSEVERRRPSLDRVVKFDYLAHRRLWHDTTPEEIAGLLEAFGPDGRTRLWWIENEPTLGLRLCDHEYAHGVAVVKLPWRERVARTNEHGLLEIAPRPGVLAADELDRRIELSLLASGVVMGVHRFEYVERDRARLRALDAVLAAEIHRREHGELPKSLLDLVPDLLARVPLDPFRGPGDPLGYEIRDDRPVVWSIGADGIDDHGRETGTGTMDIGVRIAEPPDRTKDDPEEVE